MFDTQTTEPEKPSDPHAAADAPTPASAATGLDGKRLHLDGARRLWLERGEERVRVRPVRCFPWSSPGELVSLRDDADHERCLVERLDSLDPASALALAGALCSSAFVLEIQRIESIEEDYEMRIWRTETRQGKRTFQTKLDEWPWVAPDGGHLIRDLSGDLFRLPPTHSLDEKTRQQLWAYVG